MSEERLRQAARGQAQDGAQVLRGAPPDLLDGPGVRAALSPFMAAFMVAAAMLRARVEPYPLDLLALCLRTIAFAFVVRACVDLTRAARRVLSNRDARDHVLAWDADGILYQGPAGREYVAKRDIARVVAAPLRVSGSPRRRAREVWLCLWPRAGRTHITLPPYFGPDSAVLEARLGRWLGDTRAKTPEQEEPDLDELTRAVITGEMEGASVVRSTHASADRAPLGWLLLGLISLDALRVAPTAIRAALLAPLLGAVALCITAPLLWWLWLRRRTTTPHGLSLVLTPARAVAFDRQGPVALGWETLASAEVRYRGGWSPWSGGYSIRSVELRGHEGTRLRFDGSLIDTPVEVVAALAEALAGDEEA